MCHKKQKVKKTKKQMGTIKKEVKKAEDFTPEEVRFLTKNAIKVKTKDAILFGKEAIKSKAKGREIKGGINWRLSPKDPLILNK